MSGSNINLHLPDSFSDALKRLVPSVTEETLILLEEFQSLLIQANARVNLTRIENELEFKFKHIIDSALILYALNLDLSQGRLPKDLLDFGTGGGIPGIPLSVFCDFETLMLVDARLKKLNQIELIINQMSWAQPIVKLIHDSWKSKDAKIFASKHSKVGLVTARAVGPANDLIKILTPVCANYLVLPRGPGDVKDWPTVRKFALELGFKNAQLFNFKVTWRNLDMDRLIFKFSKK